MPCAGEGLFHPGVVDCEPRVLRHDAVDIRALRPATYKLHACQAESDKVSPLNYCMRYRVHPVPAIVSHQCLYQNYKKCMSNNVDVSAYLVEGWERV